MDCPSCEHRNPSGARFCGQCGAPLIDPLRCPACEALNPGGQRFCNACGEALPEAAGTPAEEQGGRPEADPTMPEHLAEKIRAAGELEGERKNVTVLFADVMGSMDLAEATDPEEWQRIMDRFFAILCEGVHLFDGTVDKFTGDGIMALFGAPVAHEDHAQRACFAALHLIDELAAFGADLRRTKGINFLVRMGLNSGEVVVGGIGENLEMEYTAVGHTVGLAQRMEQLAEPGKAYLTEHTGSLVEGYLALNDLGEFDVKGSSRPLRVHELTGIGAASGRLDISQARGFSRFVGREEEMTILETAFEQAKEGNAQVIGVVGDAGVGKSRLCHEFTQRWRARGVPVYHTTGQAHTQSVPLMPVMRLMRAYFDISEQDSDQKARERIAGKLLLLDDSLVEDLPLIFQFLAVPDPERPAPRMDAEARQRQVLAITKRLIKAQSAERSGIHLYEDLHWLDPASEAFLANHVDAAQGTQSLTVINFRPEYRAEWMSKPYYGQIALVPLGPEAIEEMLVDQLGPDPSLADLRRVLAERTGGNPFFIEEMTRALVETGTLEGERGAFRLVGAVEDAAVPASVQVILSARIDRLGHREKTVLQAAAVIGKEFPEPVLSRVVELEPPELAEALRVLVAGGFVYEEQLYPESIYTFNHPLTQEVAYNSQLGESRAAVHAAVARAIAEQYPERLDERAALLAHHWEAAGDALEAARANAAAAAWSGTRDPSESHRHWRKVAELAATLPESEETVALGLSSRIFMLQYAWRLGTSHEEAEEVFSEGDRLASKAGDIRSRALLLGVYATVRGVNDGDTAEMAGLGAQAIALAEEAEDPALYVTVSSTAYANFVNGEYQQGAATLDRSIELLEEAPDVAADTSLGSALGNALLLKGGMLTSPGPLDQARELLDRGQEVATEQGDIEAVGWGHMWHSWAGHHGGDHEGAYAHAQQAVEIAERIGDAFSHVWAWTFLGIAENSRQRWPQSIEALECALAMSKDRRTAIESEGLRLTWLGESYAGAGEIDRGVRKVREGIEAIGDGKKPGYEPIALLSLARVLLASADPAAHDEVERVLARATELAESIDYRTVVPLISVERANLASARGDQDGHDRELAEAHRLFTEVRADTNADRIAARLGAAAG